MTRAAGDIQRLVDVGSGVLRAQWAPLDVTTLTGDIADALTGAADVPDATNPYVTVSGIVNMPTASQKAALASVNYTPAAVNPYVTVSGLTIITGAGAPSTAPTGYQLPIYVADNSLHLYVYTNAWNGPYTVSGVVL